MPYIGLPPFLPTLAAIITLPFIVSMPYIGLPPFLHIIEDGYIEQAFIVSMPYIGLPPFLLYPFKNPLKSMVSGAVFRG